MHFYFTIKSFLQKKDKIITYFVTKTFLIWRLKVYIFYLKQSISTLLDSIRETLPFYSEKQNSRAHRSDEITHYRFVQNIIFAHFKN